MPKTIIYQALKHFLKNLSINKKNLKLNVKIGKTGKNSQTT